MKRKLSLFITLALASFVATGCDLWEYLYGETPQEAAKQEDEKKEESKDNESSDNKTDGDGDKQDSTTPDEGTNPDDGDGNEDGNPDDTGDDDNPDDTGDDDGDDDQGTDIPGGGVSPGEIVDPTDYYVSITATKGTALLGQLHDLSVTKHTYYNSYSGDIDETNVLKTDPVPGTNYVRDFYSGAPTNNKVTGSGDSGWNREHVWCQNLSNGLYGKTGAGADIQHIRPTIPKLNSDRDNKKYGELNNSGKASTSKDVNNKSVQGGYYTDNVYQPMADKKGDAARIVMYLYMHYNKYNTVGGTKDGKANTGDLPITNVISASSASAAFQLLLTWNSSDPVDDIERTRNEEAAKITGCRNPFIDNSNYANMIWGS